MEFGKGLLVAGRLDNGQPLLGDVLFVEIDDKSTEWRRWVKSSGGISSNRLRNFR